MAVYDDREHYIPIRRSELIEMLCTDAGPGGVQKMSASEQEQFRRFAQILTAYYHHFYHAELERLKDLYAPFDPDADTISLNPLSDEQRQQKTSQLFQEFTRLIEKANYKRVTQQQIEEAGKEVSAWGINMDVDFSVFENIEMFSRGETMGTRMKSSWKFWEAPKPVKIPIFQRFILILKQKNHKRLGKEVDTKNVFVKVFKEIPRMDVEMLLPGARIRMSNTDRATLGGSMLGAFSYALYKFIELPGTLWMAIKGFIAGSVTFGFSLFGPVFALLGLAYKQYSGYKNKEVQYSLKLTQSLYYQNLGTNQGVLFRLIDEAEEQECREALLAYFYLLRYAEGQGGWTADNLDDYIEMDLERRAKVKVDFEIGDGLEKLLKLGLITVSGERYRAIPLPQALETIDRLWDNTFQYNQS